LIAEASPVLEDRARLLLTTPEQVGLQIVILTGCGDSASAAQAAAFAWHRLARIPAFPLNAMDVAAFYARAKQPWRPHGQLLLACSSSGEVARTVEAAASLRDDAGTLVCAVTSQETSPLATAADRVLSTDIGASFEGPALCSYVIALLALFHLAISAAEVTGRNTADEASRLRAALAATAEATGETLAQKDRAVAELAQTWSGYPAVEFLGSGPARASAAFGAAKILEAVGLRAGDQDVESFMHLQYFERAATTTPTVVIDLPGSPAAARTAEVVRYLSRLGRPHVMLTSSRTDAATTIEHAEVEETFTPIVHAAVLAQLAVELAELHDELPGRGGVGPWSDSANGAAVRIGSARGA
jgi:glutamine---fructose-6-phosphate transaminase (isomerizing)